MSQIVRSDGARWDAVTLARRGGRRDLDAVMRAGARPSFEHLVGWEFDGFNTNPFTPLLGIRKFQKGFFEGPARAPSGPEPFIQGYNIPVRQNGWEAPHESKPQPEAPRRFGFFRVHGVVDGSRDAVYPNALLLDYALGGNAFYAPERVLRDYLVKVYPDDDDLLLGRAYVALFGARVPVSYFVLRRARRHDYHG
jgi:hypothetical protein